MLFCLALLVASGPAWSSQEPAGPATTDPDALYAERESLPQAAQAEAIWADAAGAGSARLRVGLEAGARAVLAGRTRRPEAERKARLEAGIAAGRAAVALQPDRPEGHFWIAANMGALAESFGLRQGLKYRGAIKDEILAVLRLDPDLPGAAPPTARSGAGTTRCPGLFGGSKEKSEEHLRRSLTYAPQSTASLFFLAETLLAQGRRAEGIAALHGVTDAPLDPAWAPEDREFKAKARQKLQELGR